MDVIGLRLIAPVQAVRPNHREEAPMKTSDFDYELPSELIAQEPASVRDACRLLVMDRNTGALEDRVFRDIVDYVRPNDLFIVNETRVLPARLLGFKRGTGGAAEIFLLREALDILLKKYDI